MITRTKKMIYGAALAGATGMLVPVLLEAFQREAPPAPIERPASDAPSEVTVSEEAAPLLAPLPVVARELPATDLAPQEDLAVALDTSLRRLENFGTLATLPALDALASTWAARAGSDWGASGPQSDPFASVALAEFLAQHPLHGIISNGERSAALMGGRVVRVGEVLLPGVASVEAIGPRRVTLRYRGSEVQVDLPPLLPLGSSVSPSAGSTGLDGGGAQGAGGAGNKEDRDA